ncbi:uncharacterized protein LOC115891882 [Sitophilus oryzae]|uniref:Uncharacterized protein LOC115891882 n=1 Tax=Sitophilus oryzae TaxID=7048 RepID=A0A6J2YYM6_SITOR|nr:uncharacterized protein LOC115891882 [Sitophilus oryzae]
MNQITLLFIVFLIWDIKDVLTVCEDPTLCSRVLCQIPPKVCPNGQYLVYDDCGCCQYCSEKPKTGPCGTCGVDVICKESQPICTNGIIALDYCGCCKVCKSILGVNEKCTIEEPTFSVCAAELKCFEGRCVSPKCMKGT